MLLDELHAHIRFPSLSALLQRDAIVPSLSVFSSCRALKDMMICTFGARCWVVNDWLVCGLGLDGCPRQEDPVGIDSERGTVCLFCRILWWYGAALRMLMRFECAEYFSLARMVTNEAVVCLDGSKHGFCLAVLNEMVLVMCGMLAAGSGPVRSGRAAASIARS